MTRFTWTYGASEGRTIFIDDNNLQDPKGNGIGAITCHRIGNKEAERLANLFTASEDLLKACKRALHLVEDEDNNKLIVEMPGSFGLLLDLQDAIEKAEGKEAPK